MASLSGEFQTDLGPPDLLTICVEALDSIGWDIEEVTERQVVASANGSGYGAGMTIDLREAGEGTDFRIVGTDSGDELAEEDLADVLDRARDAIGERIERAATPKDEATSDWVPAPLPVEPAAAEEPEPEPPTELAPAPAPRSTPPRRPSEPPADSRGWWDRNRRAVAVGILVFCLGGAVGAAATGGGDDAKPVKRAAGKGKGASQKVETQINTVTETQSVEATTAQKTPGSSSSPSPSGSSGGAAAPGAAPATPTTPKVAKCDPGYAPQCLDPSVSDYDCEGEGDGPYYVQGPVTVIGNDRFGLDTSDHDGVGCE